MPTSVESQSYLVNALKLSAIDSPAAETAFAGLDAKVDPALAALETATTARGFASVERQYGGVFEQLGDGAAGLGADLVHDAKIFNAVNLFFGGSNALFGGGGGSGSQAFGVFDRELQTTGEALEASGADFAGLRDVTSPAGLTQLKAQLATDAANLGSDFDALSGDLTTLIGQLGGVRPKAVTAAATTNSPYAAIVGALSPIPTELADIGGGFTNLSELFGGVVYSVTPEVSVSGAGASADILSGGGTGTVGSTLSGLHADFNTLDGSLQALAGPIANLLLPAVTTPTTV